MKVGVFLTASTFWTKCWSDATMSYVANWTSGKSLDIFLNVGYTRPHGMQSSIFTIRTAYLGDRAIHGVYSVAVIAKMFILLFAEQNNVTNVQHTL